ncbi:MAG: tetratricopeptide repeat protein [FCB group bacterium]|nr:tetratricopeptide repeat protein [FCB group bacterium]
MFRIIILALVGLLAIGCSSGLYTQGQKLVEEEKYDRAIETFYRSIKINPESADSWRELGVAFFKKGDLVKAEDALKQSNAIRPHARTNLFLGLLYEKQEDLTNAIEAYRISLAYNPKGRTRDMIESHLDRLITQNVKREVAVALDGEADIDVSAIPENTIAVVDFDNTHLSPEMAPISKGLAEFTSIDLSKVASLRVIDRLKIDAIISELKLSSSQYSDPSYAPRVGRLLGSSRLVTGSVLGIGEDGIRLDGAVVSTRDSAALTTETTEGKLASFFRVQKDFVFKVIDEMGISLTSSERDAIEEVPTESHLAFLAYCRGLDYKSRGMFNEARQEFNVAAGQDKGFEAAGVAAKAMGRMPSAGGTGGTGGGGSGEQFEVSVVGESDLEITVTGLDQVQTISLSSSGFVFGSQQFDLRNVWAGFPPQLTDAFQQGVLIIRGNLDVDQ